MLLLFSVYFTQQQVIQRLIQWFMPYFPKIFDSHSSVSFANAFVLDPVSRKSPVDAVQICHKCVRVAVHQAFHQAPLQIRWMTAIKPVNIIQIWDDVRLLPVLVQHQVLGAVKPHSINRICMIFAIHWLWKPHHMHTVVVARRQHQHQVAEIMHKTKKIRNQNQCTRKFCK